MKLAIHHKPGSFSDRWIPYCDKKNIPYKIVNCYDSNIISQLEDCDGLMWHWDLNDYQAALFVRQLTFSLEKIGKKVFPDIRTSWHYEDKVGQKYLLEAIAAPMVNTYIFYSKADALKWLDKTILPKVFKLRNGASSSNVQLVKNKKKAKKLVNKAFGKGFPHVSPYGRFKERLYILNRDRNLKGLKLFMGGLARFFIPTKAEKFSSLENGYIYFQDFISDNDFDTRLVVIGDRCFGFRRYNRKNDFRASGSGDLAYEKELFNEKMIKIAFEVATKLKSQSIAFDFLYENGEPKIMEISYCFVMGKYYDSCTFYWDKNLNLHYDEVDPQKYMIEDFINTINEN
jgi:glutathione synthase/RimK-type ligase-like ATP-grasp enzyme